MFVDEVGSKASLTYVTDSVYIFVCKLYNINWSILIKFKFTLYFLSLTNVRALVFMLHTCACVHGVLFLSISVCVFILRTCVCVCSRCECALVFMLRTCECVHVAYVCFCSCCS